MLFPQVYFSMSSSSNSQPFLHAAVVKASQVSSTGIYTRQAGGETPNRPALLQWLLNSLPPVTTGAIDSL